MGGGGVLGGVVVYMQLPTIAMLTQTAKSLFYNYMTCSATHFNVPMVTADFLTALLKALAGVTRTHTHAHTLITSHP